MENKKWLHSLLAVLKADKLLRPKLTFGSADATEPAARIQSQQDFEPWRGLGLLVGWVLG